MEQSHVIAHHIAILFFDQRKAEIHIVVGHGKHFRKAPHGIVFLFGDHQARCCHSHQVHHAAVASAVVGYGIAVTEQLVHRAFVHIGDPAVLDQVPVRIVQLSAHGARLRQSRLPEHALDPVRRDHFGIIIQQKVIVAGCLFCRQITHPGKVKIHRHIAVAEVILFRQRFVFRLILCAAAVIDHNDLEVRICTLLPDGSHSPLQDLRVVFGGDQDAHLLSSIFIDRVKQAIGCFLPLRPSAAALKERLLQSHILSAAAKRFCDQHIAECLRGVVQRPVEQHFRDMHRRIFLHHGKTQNVKKPKPVLSRRSFICDSHVLCRKSFLCRSRSRRLQGCDLLCMMLSSLRAHRNDAANIKIR